MPSPASLPAQSLHLHLHCYDDTEQAALVLVLPQRSVVQLFLWSCELRFHCVPVLS